MGETEKHHRPAAFEPVVAQFNTIVVQQAKYRELARLRQAQCELRFGPSIWVDFGPQILVTVLAVSFALYLDDYRVMLWMVLVQAESYTLLSNLVAERRYNWA